MADACEGGARASEERARTEGRFRAAPFPLYGLPPEWDGPRYLGGGWWGGQPGHERAKSLSLVHGSLMQGEGPMLAVETGMEFSIGGGDLLSIAGLVWEARCANVEEAIAELGRDGGRNRPAPIPQPIGFVIDIDGVDTRFDGFIRGAEWVARAKVGSLYVTLWAHGFDPADVALVPVADIEPYILGTRASDEQDY